MADPQWQQLARRITGRSLAIWTYWELGRDLLGDPSPQRRNFLRQLIQTMRLPKGNIAFWPLAVPQGAELAPDVHCFWRGVSRYMAEQVFCFGPEARTALESAEASKAKQLYAPTASITFLPAVDSLAQQPAVGFMEHLLQLMQAHRAL